MELTSLETGMTIAGTFFTTALTLGKYMKSSLQDMSRRIDCLTSAVAGVDKTLAVHAVVINDIKESLK